MEDDKLEVYKMIIKGEIDPKNEKEVVNCDWHCTGSGTERFDYTTKAVYSHDNKVYDVIEYATMFGNETFVNSVSIERR